MNPILARVLLWCAVLLAALTVAIMTWHPWVAGSRSGCAPGTARGWDGFCRAAR